MGMSGVARIVRRTSVTLTVIVTMVMRVVMALVVRMPGHNPILRGSKVGRPSGALIRHFDTALAGMD